ncbi:MAG: hypothetical protein AAFP79_16005 [Pseudomonadota bacterium]
MTLEAIYFIGQTVAAFAIVGSLIFVGIQSRQASKASELATLQVMQERFDGFRRMVVADKELVDLYDRGLRDPVELDATELVRFRLMIFIAVEGAQASFLVKDHSERAQRHFEALDLLFVRTMGTPGGRAWFAMFSNTLHPDFVSHMSKVLSSAPMSRIVTKEDWIAALNTLAVDNVERGKVK